MKRIFIFLHTQFLILFFAFGQEQENLTFPFTIYDHEFVVGLNVAYLPQNIEPDNYLYNEWIGSIKLTYPLVPWIRAGFEINNIYSYSEKSRNYYTVGGITTEIIRFGRKKHQLYFLTNLM